MITNEILNNEFKDVIEKYDLDFRKTSKLYNRKVTEYIFNDIKKKSLDEVDFIDSKGIYGRRFLNAFDTFCKKNRSSLDKLKSYQEEELNFKTK